MDQALGDAAAREQHRIDPRPVVAAALAVDLRGAAEFARHPEERRVEHATTVEVGDEPRDRVIERCHLVEAAVSHVDVRVPAAIFDGDEPGAGFHQPAGDDQPLRQALGVILAVGALHGTGHLAAVELERLIGLALERERLLGVGRREQRVGALIELVHRVERVGIGFQLPHLLLDQFPRLLAAVEPVERDALGNREVADLEPLVFRIGVELERTVGAAHEASATDEPRHARDRDERRQVATRAEFVGDDRPHRRVVDHGGRRVALEEVVGRQAVVGNLADDTPHDRDLVEDLGGLRQVFTEDVAALRLQDAERPAILRRRLRLRVERLVVRKAAGEMELDHAEGLRGSLHTGARLRGKCRRASLTAGFEPQQIAERQSEGAEHAGPHGLPSGGHGAKSLTAAGIDTGATRMPANTV